MKPAKRSRSGARAKRAIKYWYVEKGQRRCRFCGVQLTYKQGELRSAEIDHIIPHSKNGTQAIINTIMICNRCNRAKADLGLTAFARKVDAPNIAWFAKKEMAAREHYASVGRRILS